MKGVSFPEQSTVYGKPAGWKDADCYGLPVAQTVYANSDGSLVPCLISCWEGELTDAQIAEIVRTRKVKIFQSITGASLPPSCLMIESPFPGDYNKEAALDAFIEATGLKR